MYMCIVKLYTMDVTGTSESENYHKVTSAAFMRSIHNSERVALGSDVSTS